MDAILVAAEATGWICSKRLVAALPDLLPALEQEGAVALSATVRAQVLALSAATIDRRLSVERRAHHPHGISTTKPGSLLRSQIPIRTFTPWAEETPGFLEIDLVAHCGDSAAGDFVYTLTAVDVATGWTECVALPNKRQVAIRAALQDLRHLFPFPIRGIDCDNGSEFLNEIVLQYCRTHRWTFTRCRAYHKNDQAHVEEKNGSLVRHIIGYERYEGAPATDQMNRIYALLHGYFNHILPSFKLIGKERIGSRVRKHDGPTLTPYHRALDAGVLRPGYSGQLLHGPLTCRRLIDAEVGRLHAMAHQRMTSGITIAAGDEKGMRRTQHQGMDMMDNSAELPTDPHPDDDDHHPYDD